MPLERKYVILAVVVGFVAWALLTDWIPSLRWIPHAFLAGALAAVLGFLYLVATTSRGIEDSRRSHGRSAAIVSLAFTSPQNWEEEKAVLQARGEYRRPAILPEARIFSKSVDELLDLILRDYVTSWYGQISSRPLFQNEIDRCIRSVLLTISARLMDLDLVEIGIARILPTITTHLKDFYDAEHAVRGKDLKSNVTESDELDTAIASKYKAGRLHTSAALANSETLPAQQSHLRRLIERILPIVLPSNMKTSPAVLVLIRELVTCAVLTAIFSMLSEPDTWNQMIVNFGGPWLQDRKTVRKVRAALDQHAPVTPKNARFSQFPRLRPYDTERQFEKFVRTIRQVNTLSEARRFRSEINSQLRKESAVAGQDAAYMRRLETCKRLLDQRIEALSKNGASTRPQLTVRPSTSGEDAASRKSQASLREIIYDAAGLGYFMEFMDRLKLMRLVQFYLVVDGFRGPLEGDDDEVPASMAQDPERMDIAQMYEGYLNKPEVHVYDAAMTTVKQYLAKGRSAGPEDYIEARRAVLRTQTQIFTYMKKAHFDNFKRSDLYFKWLAIDDNPALTNLQSKQLSSPLSPESPLGSEGSPVRARRPQPAALQREPELRRAVLSTTDLKEFSRSSSVSQDVRRSFDDHSRPALFEDEVEDERLTQSLTNLKAHDSDTDSTLQAKDEARAVSDMQLALDDIVNQDNDRDSLFSEARRPSSDIPERKSSLDVRPALTARPSDKHKISIASLGLVGEPSSRGVFVDDLFAEEAQKFAEDEREDANNASGDDEDPIEEAAPGDLGLTEAIHTLNAEIEKLSAQKGVLDSLTAKAELTNNAAELRILRKSEQSLHREIKRKEMQKQQYVVQESDNSLYGRAAVSIKSVMVGKEDDGHEYALYVIEVRRQAGDQMPAATWAVTRRYSQFHELHKRLRARFPSVKELDFPRRQTLFTLQRDFIEKRRTVLERYLRSLLLAPAICRSRELRAFLSQAAIATNGADGSQVDAKDFVTRIYNSVSDGMEDFLGNIPVLDQLSVAGQNLISAATAQINNGAAIDSLDPTTRDPNTAAEAEAELNAYEAKEAEPFVKPICDLFLETFELSKGNSWLRGRTVVVVLHQLLGGTIERRVRDAAKTTFQDESLARYVNMVRDIMWPGGKMRVAPTPRTAAEKTRTRREAELLLGALIPDLAGSVVGRANAQAASRKIIAALNNRRLNTHIIYTLVDDIIRIVFPEMIENR